VGRSRIYRILLPHRALPLAASYVVMLREQEKRKSNVAENASVNVIFFIGLGYRVE
jgi:hypothetical protein